MRTYNGVASLPSKNPEKLLLLNVLNQAVKDYKNGREEEKAEILTDLKNNKLLNLIPETELVIEMLENS